MTDQCHMKIVWLVWVFWCKEVLTSQCIQVFLWTETGYTMALLFMRFMYMYMYIVYSEGTGHGYGIGSLWTLHHAIDMEAWNWSLTCEKLSFTCHFSSPTSSLPETVLRDDFTLHCQQALPCNKPNFRTIMDLIYWRARVVTQMKIEL